MCANPSGAEIRGRRQARIAALEALYEMDLSGHAAETALERRLAEEPLPEEGAAFARALLHGVGQHRRQIDDLILQVAPLWPLAQMAVTDRNILRLAIYEIMFDNRVPLRVAINEAVELAKAFGSDNAPRFINGALGAISQMAPSHNTETGGG
mgnify:CR=1 FL=1